MSDRRSRAEDRFGDPEEHPHLGPSEGTPRSAGVLDTLTPRGPELLTSYRADDTLAVTVEPAGGSPQPTTQPIAAVNLA
ncbi:anti-sigma factor [Nocardia sp. NPDC050710]|uniref:anti-sigma factor n=1 Tax=Nocardia sp. NPDC050710 TaxID=3157220 RepID=UPI0034069132